MPRIVGRNHRQQPRIGLRSSSADANSNAVHTHPTLLRICVQPSRRIDHTRTPHRSIEVNQQRAPPPNIRIARVLASSSTARTPTPNAANTSGCTPRSINSSQRRRHTQLQRNTQRLALPYLVL